MANMLAVAQVRDALGDSGDPPAWSDAELGARLDGNGGLIAVSVESCLLELTAEAAGRFNYTIGSSQSSVGNIFDQLRNLLDVWTARAKIERQQADKAAQSAEGLAPTAVAVEWVF